MPPRSTMTSMADQQPNIQQFLALSQYACLGCRSFFIKSPKLLAQKNHKFSECLSNRKIVLQLVDFITSYHILYS